jgi:two-component system, OmpR family, sensor histidine kinase KdpD
VRLALRALLSVIGAGLVTVGAILLVPPEVRDAGRVAPTVGFTYLLLVLAIATGWGFIEAAITSVVSTLSLNYFFLPPIGRFTIADPQNWVALFSFLGTSLIASRLSTLAKQRALDAIARQQDLERLYTFSRAILLIDQKDSFAKELVRILADVFPFTAVVLYDRESDQFHRAGPSDFEGLDDQLRDAALQGTSYADPASSKTITAVRLGSHPIAGLGLQGERMPDSVVQGIANLVAIGLERARAQDLAAQVEAARQSEKLRTSLLDAMAHEFKTPLTSVKAAASALAEKLPRDRAEYELATIIGEESDRLEGLVNDATQVLRLESGDFRMRRTLIRVHDLAAQTAADLHARLDGRTFVNAIPPDLAIDADASLLRVALRHLADNAIKYSPAGATITFAAQPAGANGTVDLTVHNTGSAVPPDEASRLFDRFYRAAPSLSIAGSGMGLAIVRQIARAHGGDAALDTDPTGTSFRITLPQEMRAR